MCHPIALTGVDIDFELNEADSSILLPLVRCKGETGVEMEALTTASVAALTVYDMCKAVQKDIVIDNLHLLKDRRQIRRLRLQRRIATWQR